MLHTRWQPVLWRARNLANQETGRVFAATYPAVNLWEDGDNFYAQAELPGVPADRLEVVVSEGEEQARMFGESLAIGLRLAQGAG